MSADGGGDWEYSIYGGRVDNPFDQRVLKQCLNTYFNDKMVSGKGQLMKGASVPSSNRAEDYHNAISKIPGVTPPGSSRCRTTWRG